MSITFYAAALAAKYGAGARVGFIASATVADDHRFGLVVQAARPVCIARATFLQNLIGPVEYGCGVVISRSPIALYNWYSIGAAYVARLHKSMVWTINRK